MSETIDDILTNAPDLEEARSSRPPGGAKHPERAVAIISVILIVAGVGLIQTLPDQSEATRSGSLWLTVAIVLGFAATEYTAFQFTFRRESTAFSLSEVPVAFSLVFLAPGPALLVRAIGSLSIILFVRRPPIFKVLFNVALLCFEVGLAYVVFRGVLSEWGTSDQQLVIAAILATSISDVASSVFLSVAISLFEGGLWKRIASEVRLSWWIFTVNSALAGMVLGLALISPYLVLVAIFPVGMLWYVIKEHGVIDQRLRDLNAVHGFTGRVGQSLDPREISQAGVVEAAGVLRTEGTALVLFDNDTGVMIQSHGTVGVWLPTEATDEVWAPYLQAEHAKVVDGDDLAPICHAGSRVKELMVAPIRDRSGAIGLMVVAGRTGAAKRFGQDDLVRLQNLTEQLTSSLRRGMLHQRIEREARIDGLTGLPNRSSFERALTRIASKRHDDAQLFVVMLDLDRFKEVNDTLGHIAGDELLVEVARRLKDVVGPHDVLARLASDEFAVVGTRHDRDETLELAWNCVREVGRPVTLDGLEIVVTASAGLAIVDDPFEEGAPLRFADIAMFNAKTQRLGVEVYRDEIDRRTPARLSMLGDLRAAIENEDLHVHLQPKLDLTTGTVVGAEALVRWTHPARGVVPPTQFVRVAEDTGLIKQLTDLMLHRGIIELRRIHERGYHLGLAVNLSTHDLLDIRLAQRVDEHLRANHVDPAMLTLEITESSLLIDAPRARATINELNEVGVRLSIDDFGTGYSSLSYLRRLPVTELKIDQSFVANVLLDAQDEVIVRSTIDLGHNLGLVVVAEGVENNEVLERLREFGCDIAQGYCISRPLEPVHLLSWLATTSHPSLKSDPLDFSRWVDTGQPTVPAEPHWSVD